MDKSEMDKDVKAGIGCLFFVLMGLAALLVSVAVGFMFGIEWGFFAMAAFSALTALYLLLAVYVDRGKGGR